MKLVLVTLMLLVSPALYAQSQGEKIRISRQELSEAQAMYISRMLGFDEETARKFESLYLMQQREIWALSPEESVKPSDRTDAEVDRAIREGFERSEQILAIRKKYYKEYRRFLSPQQVERIYQLDRHTMVRLGRLPHINWGSVDSILRNNKFLRGVRIPNHLSRESVDSILRNNKFLRDIRIYRHRR